MKYRADLHIHSRFSRATSKKLNLSILYKWSKIKGIHLLGTGDFTHPTWFSELTEQLEPAEPGLFKLRHEYSGPIDKELPESVKNNPVRFALSVEISSIYKKNNKTRKVHNVIMMPCLKSGASFASGLDKRGNIRSDGRPILGIDSRDLLEIALECSENTFFFPAHIWTPHFSVLGAFSSFESIDECFGDLANHVFAAETGLSSDPAMNWRVSSLDRFTLISNSDAHSAQKIAREANLFDTDFSFLSMLEAIKTRKGFLGTLEFFPEEGKYHMDGHRNCGVCLAPADTIKLDGICPECKKKLTLGVSHRLEKLADRPFTTIPPPGRQPFYSLIPLAEIISEIVKTGPQTKKVTNLYMNMISIFGSEMDILYGLDESVLTGYINRCKEKPFDQICGAVLKARTGKVFKSPGYDGEYGKIKIYDPREK
jgi:uncharacterized protein (TIGR00375 family)